MKIGSISVFFCKIWTFEIQYWLIKIILMCFLYMYMRRAESCVRKGDFFHGFNLDNILRNGNLGEGLWEREKAVDLRMPQCFG